MASYDPLTGMLKKPGQPAPDTDPTGRLGLGLYGAAPRGPGVSPTSPGSSYANLLTVPGTKPDFLGILNSDPLLQLLKTNQGSEQIADRSQLAAARQRALGQFGEVPDFSNSLGIVGSDINEDITPDVRSLAAQNTQEGLSTVARLQHEYNRVKQNIADSLAARGGLRSGALGVALNDLNLEHKQSLSDAEQQVLDYLQGAQSAYQQSQRQRQAALAQGQAEAAGRIDPSQLYGTPAVTATHIGGGVYRSADGRLWNADGSPYNGPAPGTSEPPRQPGTLDVITGPFPGSSAVSQAAHTAAGMVGGLSTPQRVVRHAGSAASRFA